MCRASRASEPRGCRSARLRVDRGRAAILGPHAVWISRERADDGEPGSTELRLRVETVQETRGARPWTMSSGDGARQAIEAAAPDWLRPQTYVEPFALKALGFARADAAMLSDAAARFDAMELDWFAAETRQVLASIE